VLKKKTQFQKGKKKQYTIIFGDLQQGSQDSPSSREDVAPVHVLEHHAREGFPLLLELIERLANAAKEN
jgi:hypothetical protein